MSEAVIYQWRRMIVTPSREITEVRNANDWMPAQWSEGEARALRELDGSLLLLAWTWMYTAEKSCIKIRQLFSTSWFSMGCLAITNLWCKTTKLNNLHKLFMFIKRWKINQLIMNNHPSSDDRSYITTTAATTTTYKRILI